MTQPEEDTARIDMLIVPLERWKVYHHLRALCAKDGRFEILDVGPLPEFLEKLCVYDAQKLKEAEWGEETARRARIGMAPLLQGAGNTTVIMFDGKDAATEEGRTLFRQFPGLVQDHFEAIFPETMSRQGEAMNDGTGNEEILERQKSPRIIQRRKEVKELWVQGLTDCEIAERLACGESTVKRDRNVMGLKTRK